MNYNEQHSTKNKTERFLDTIEKKVFKYNDVVLADAQSPSRHTKNNPKSAELIRRIGLKQAMCITDLVKSIKDMKKNPGRPKAYAEDDFFTVLEKEAKGLGAHAVGYVKVPRNLIFKDKGILYGNAILLTIEMDRESIAKAPDIDTAVTFMDAYYKLGIITNKLAEYLRDNGFGAQAGPAIAGLTYYPELFEYAGMGVRGRNGVLISPEIGPRHRLAVVYTSIENLPLKDGNPHLWIKEFCKKCGRCIKKCPSGAIYEDVIEGENERKFYFNADKCGSYMGKNNGCGVCIKECPFNTQGYENIKGRQI